MPPPSGYANTARHASPGGAPESPLTVKDRSSEPVQGWRPWGIGGSDIGALLGLSPYRCAVDVWLDKVNTGGGAVPRPALPMRLGNFLEPFVVEEYERLTSNRTRRQVATLHHPEHAELFGHVDRIATSNSTTENNSAQACGQDVVLECKTCSAFRANEWGPAWSDEVPAEYLAQCLWYLGLTGCEEAHLAVLLEHRLQGLQNQARPQDRGPHVHARPQVLGGSRADEAATSTQDPGTGPVALPQPNP